MNIRSSHCRRVNEIAQAIVWLEFPARVVVNRPSRGLRFAHDDKINKIEKTL